MGEDDALREAAASAREALAKLIKIAAERVGDDAGAKGWLAAGELAMAAIDALAERGDLEAIGRAREALDGCDTTAAGEQRRAYRMVAEAGRAATARGACRETVARVLVARLRRIRGLARADRVDLTWLVERLGAYDPHGRKGRPGASLVLAEIAAQCSAWGVKPETIAAARKAIVQNVRRYRSNAE